MIKRITLLTFVRQQCCNFIPNECLGVDLFGKRFRNQGVCHIVEKEPCLFFERCVLPVANQMGGGNVVRQYQRVNGFELAKTRYCECSVELLKNKKFCKKCRTRRRRETKSKYQRKYRGSK
jgi:hypothetical protein|tara:strand:+ start:5808 stop:6170 length:363 start_codon:yes stop_codon:yes gene_type:complete